MSELNEHVLESLRGELKLAFSPRISSALGALGAGGGVGAAGGALLGAAVKGGRKYLQERDQGASVTEALGGSLAHAGSGALQGAAIGGAAGALGGGALGAARPELGTRFRAAVDKLPGAHFGQRQVHTFTGWKPEGGLGAIGHGAAPRLGAVRQAEQELFAARAGKASPGLVDRVMGRSAVQGAEKRVARARDAYDAGRKAEEMGLTSIPGYAKALRDRPVGEVLRTAANDQWKGMSPAMKALTVGMPALELAGAIRGPSGEDAQGRTKSERIGRSLAQTAGGLAFSPLTMTGQMVAGTALSRAGERAGRLLRPRRPSGGVVSQSPDLTADNGQAVAGERHITERAAGSPGTETFNA